MIDKNQPIIVKKIKKGGHGHHGGAWKVAYADFVTAMMAFFLLMWLLASSSPEQQQAISDYFQNPSPVFGPGGSSTSVIDLGSSVDVPAMKLGKNGEPMSNSQQNVEQMAEQLEQQRLEQLKMQLEYAIDKNPELKGFRQQMVIEMTDEGLRIQLLDEQNRPMFDLGSAKLKPYMNKILHVVAKVINAVPNKVSITGHTDARPYPGQRGYTNWELSSDRANASRRELLAGGMNPDRIGRVEGLSSSALLHKDKPYDPRNRRISITVLKKKVSDDISRKAGAYSTPESAPASKGAASAAPGSKADPEPAAVNPLPAATQGTPPPLFQLPVAPAH